jgi:dehydrogenase/reductase SDR family protein 4
MESHMPGMFEGKVAIVTGSTRGIGHATARILGERGAKIVVTSRKPEACAEAAEAFRSQGIEAIGIACHVAKREDRERLVAETLAAFGSIDIFVANAAVNPIAAPIQDIPDDVWDKIIDTNLTSTWAFSKLILPGMAERGGGTMVVVSSIASLRAARVSAAYAISKAAENHLVRQLAAYWGPKGIRVNCVIPGATRTDMLRNITVSEEASQKIIDAAPLRRIGEPEDVGEAIAFFASDAARQITGQMLTVDGGETIM